jgi:acetyltransferase-like isoleucine patch superfamily enzyme/acyl carrier protein
MILRDLAFRVFAKAWSRVRLERSLHKLRASGACAEEPRWLGTPFLEISGGVKIGRGFTLRSEPVQSHVVVHEGAELEIGDNVSIGSGSGIACHTRIAIGDDTQCGSYVMILDTDFHVPGNPGAVAVPEPIFIGQRVRIGNHVTILRGSLIEDDARISSGSVVSGHISRGASVSGVPAREIHVRIQDTSAAGTRDAVLRIAQQSFRLDTLPSLSDGPDQIARWSSLGALSFLLAIEASFGININVDESSKVRSLAEVVDLVQRTLRAQGPRPENTQYTENPSSRGRRDGVTPEPTRDADKPSRASSGRR